MQVLRYRRPVALAGPLVERTAELKVLDEAVRAARDGRGGVVMIEGPAGIGKTSLLEEARRLATADGMAVLAGQGAVLERDFGFGVVRQLFEPMLAARTGASRKRLLAGAAGLASPVVSPQDSPTGADAPSQQATAVHGLYWLTANLAEESPLLIVVDDVHWCDSPSIRFLAYLARRLEGLPVLVLMGLRTGDPPVDAAAIAEVGAGPAVKVNRPAPLSIDGVNQLVRHGMGEAAEAGFVEACREATGGNPFLVGELVRVLRADGVRPTEAAAAEIARAGPPTVAQATMLRMSRLAPAAAAVAQAVAVLGRHARIDRIASLAELDADSTRDALDTLVAMEVLTAGPPVAFVHALVHQAIYDDLLESVRADAHGRAARMMAAEAAPADEVAAHLLMSSPMGDPDVVSALRTAAARALARGATQGAVAYLRRALSEGVAEIDRAAVLRELGAAEAFVRDPRAAVDLGEAMALTTDPLERTRTAFQLSEVYGLSGQWELRRARLTAALAELGDRDPDLLARIEAARATTDFYDPDLAEEFEARLPSLREVVDQGHPASRLLAIVLGCVGACRGMDRADVLALVERGLDGGRFLGDEGPESLILPQAVGALLAFEETDAAEEATKGVFDEALRRGSVMGYVAGSYYRVAIDTQRGALKDADVHLHTMVELSLEHGLTFALPSGFYFGLDALLERPQLADVAALVESIELDPSFAATVSGAYVLIARGRLRSASGAQDEALTDLRRAGEIVSGARIQNPIIALWRSPLALVLPEDSRLEARELVAEELRLAVSAGIPRSQAVALRASAVIEGGRRSIGLLEQSLRLLEHTDARLERARTLVELGAAMRRANERVAAREPLRNGLDLAHRCGAERLAARAAEELVISGARPRRPVVSGPDALTAGEARVARLAAEGRSNREIAQRLFVTTKTVENQLSSAYRKLRVSSREELAPALAAAPA